MHPKEVTDEYHYFIVLIQAQHNQAAVSVNHIGSYEQCCSGRRHRGFDQTFY
jgi:hypothetical protein